MADRSQQLSLWVSLLWVLVAVVSSECENNSCPEQHSNAIRTELLGAVQRCPNQQRNFTYDTIKNGIKELDSEVYSIAWSGADDEWVWVITTGTSSGPGPHQLYKSNDKGVTFELLSPKLVQAIRDYKASKKEAFQEQYDPAHSSVSAIFVHPANVKKVLLWADGFYHFISEDAGETWKAIEAPPGTWGLSHIVKPHPTKADWLLTIASRKECYSHTGVCTQDIFYSPDFGTTWRNLTSVSKFAGFTDFDWGWHSGDVNYTKLFTETTILATAHEGPLDPSQENAGEIFQLYRTDDFFKNTKQLAICGNAFELVAGQIFFARTDMCPVDFKGNKRTIDINKDLNHVTLYTSSDGTTFQEVCLPTELRDRSYMMVSAHDGKTAFVLGDHDDGPNPVSNLYANGNIAELYSLSLRNVYYGYRPGRSPGSTYPDIAAITPIQGRFIANQQLSSNPAEPYRITSNDFNTVAVTLITHNSGASWDKIYVPSDNIQYDVCKGTCKNPADCYLHLHGQSSWVRGVYGRPAVYSSPSAPGLVMASGNLGPESEGLSSDKDKLCTWLSTDGGITWHDVADDMYIYEFFNHGNGIVMAKFREEGPATEICVSLDRGVCWYNINVTSSPTDQIYIDNIRVEPDGAARIFHVMGTKHATNAYGEDIKKAVIITVDMADVLKKADSSGIVMDAPVCNPVTDIEDWQPTTEKGDPMCILGRFRKIKRRGTSNSPCLLAKDYERPILPEQSCPCAANDLYCEYGYEKVAGDQSKCGPLRMGSAPACPAITEGRYKPSQSHLRLPRHGQCENLNTFIPDSDGNGATTEQKWAGKKEKKGLSTGFIWLIVLGSLGAAVVAFVKFAPDHIKDQAMYITEPIIGAAIWAMDRVTALFNRVTNRDHGDMGFERLQASNQADESLYAAP